MHLRIKFAEEVHDVKPVSHTIYFVLFELEVCYPMGWVRDMEFVTSYWGRYIVTEACNGEWYEVKSFWILILCVFRHYNAPIIKTMFHTSSCNQRYLKRCYAIGTQELTVKLNNAIHLSMSSLSQGIVNVTEACREIRSSKKLAKFLEVVILIILFLILFF